MTYKFKIVHEPRMSRSYDKTTHYTEYYRLMVELPERWTKIKESNIDFTI